MIILGGYFAVVGRFLTEPMTAELRARVFAPDLAGARVVLSTLGFTAAVRGGAHVALESVVGDTRVGSSNTDASPAHSPTRTENTA